MKFVDSIVARFQFTILRSQDIYVAVLKHGTQLMEAMKDYRCVFFPEAAPSCFHILSWIATVINFTAVISGSEKAKKTSFGCSKNSCLLE